MNNILIGTLMMFLGSFGVAVANGVCPKVTRAISKAGAKARGARRDKVSTAIAYLLTVLAIAVVDFALYVLPMLAMFQACELLGLVNWTVFFQYFAQNFVGIFLFSIIYRKIAETDSIAILRSEFNNADQPQKKDERKQ